MKTFARALALALGPLSATPAFAAGGNCPTAPQNYDAAVCNNRCIRNASGIMVCDITALAGNNDVVVVKNYPNFVLAGTERYSAWGTANGANFCCALDSTAGSPINGVEVY